MTVNRIMRKPNTTKQEKWDPAKELRLKTYVIANSQMRGKLARKKAKREPAAGTRMRSWSLSRFSNSKLVTADAEVGPLFFT